MPNHYHLLLELDMPENLSVMIAGLNRAYTHYYHATYHTAGYLWQGRFKSQPVEKERYLIACGRYIERNPVRARFPIEDEWASEHPQLFKLLFKNSLVHIYSVNLRDQ